MKKYLMIILAGTAMAVTSASLMAAPFDQNYGNDHGNSQGHDDHHDHGHDHDQHYEGMHDRGRHEGWYKKGGHMPEEYRGTRYVVTDWHHERLREPPRGYNWVRSDNGDFLLVAITTGVITDLILNH